MYGLLKYCEYTGKTPSFLINEAREDFINRVPPWELRYVKQIEGLVSSFDGSMANWTKIGIIKAVKNFYKFNKIPAMGLNYSRIPMMATEKYLDTPVLKIEDVRRAVQICGIKVEGDNNWLIIQNASINPESGKNGAQ